MIDYHNDTKKEEIDIQEVITILWKDKLTILLITSLFSVLSVIYALNKPNLYQASALVEIIDDNSQSSSILGGQLGGLGGMASNLGIPLPGISGDKSSLVVETLKSKIFIKSILETPNTKEIIYAAESYDINSNEIVFNEKIFDSKSKKWIRQVSSGRSIEPSYIEVHEHLRGSYAVVKDTKTGFITISYTHLSPLFANDFINLVINTANNIAREREIKKAESALEYLNIQLNKTNIRDIEESINSLIEAQLKVLMLANIRENYLIRPIDPSFVPEIKSFPNRKLICIIGAMLGVILSVFIVILRSFLEKK